jgi:2-polyprenyl-6-methoxyphenol hydroxylase-like FAD-dependent oxidoreductase
MSTPARTAVVVGGGIGGLSAAIGLRRIGWHVTVLERARRFAPVGAGITLWPNAVRALAALGVHVDVRAMPTSAVLGSIAKWADWTPPRLPAGL